MKSFFNPYKTLNHEIHYITSFIGGCMEVTSFIFLYKALIGFMTSNLVFGLVSLSKGKFNFESFYHIQLIIIWMIYSAIHQFLHIKLSKKLATPWHLYAVAMTINCILLLIFILGGEYLKVSGYLGATPVPAVIPLIAVGLLFMYIQNFVIQHGGTSYPCSTSVVTSVYVFCVTNFMKLINKEDTPEARANNLRAGIHYLMILIHFAIGAFLTAVLSKYIGFYTLTLGLIVLICLTSRLWFAHSKHKVILRSEV